MITTLRRMFASKLGVAIAIGFIALMGLGFALSDVNNFSSNSGVSAGHVARVGSREIGINEIRQRFDREFAEAQQRQPGLTKEQFIATGALDRIVRQVTEITAIEQFARSRGVGIDPEVINAAIARNPSFAGVNGSFSREVFLSRIASVGINERQLHTNMEADAIVRQLVAPIALIGGVPNNLALPYASLLLEQREGQAIAIPAARFGPTAAPTDAQLSRYYADNRARYTIPERRAVRFAMLDESALPAIAPVTAAEVAAEYRANAARYAASETRRFSQVIAGTREAAQRIAAAAGSGSLDAAARAAGLSASELTASSAEELTAATNAAFARATFAAQSGAIVGPVQVPLGWAVAKISNVERTPARSLAQATAEITTALQARKRQEAMVDMFNSIQDALNGGASVAEVASERSLRVVTTPPLLANGTAPDQPTYRADPLLPMLLGPAFQAVEGSAGQIITVQENKVFALVDVARIVPAAPPPLASIRERVVADWRKHEGGRVARDKARQILAAVERGQSLAAAAVAAGVPGTPQTLTGSRINLSNPNQRIPAAIALLFSMAPGSVKTLELPNGEGWAVIRLARSIRGNASTNPQLVQAVQQQFGGALGDEYISIIVAAARREFPITIDNEAVERLRAELSGTATAAPTGN